MSTSARPSLRPSAPDQLHAVFMTLLPRIERHGRIYFRHLRPHNKADAIQEMRAWPGSGSCGCTNRAGTPATS